MTNEVEKFNKEYDVTKIFGALQRTFSASGNLTPITQDLVIGNRVLTNPEKHTIRYIDLYHNIVCFYYDRYEDFVIQIGTIEDFIKSFSEVTGNNNMDEYKIKVEIEK